MVQLTRRAIKAMQEAADVVTFGSPIREALEVEILRALRLSSGKEPEFVAEVVQAAREVMDQQAVPATDATRFLEEFTNRFQP